jgi:maltose O-acetyltransferase
MLKVLGMLVYAFLRRVNSRFFLPRSLSNWIESMRTRALIWQGACIGADSLVRSNVFIAFPKNLKLGARVKIGDYARIYNFSDFVVGNDTEIGPGLHVQTNGHKWSSLEKPIAKQGSCTKAVEVGHSAYLGANVTLLSGVSVGSSLIVAAGAVATKSLADGAVYGGVPAKKIRDL